MTERPLASQASAGSRPSDLAEMALALVFGYGCHLYYNPVGHLASLEGRDLAALIATALDAGIPFQPVWVLFYQMAYFAPALVLAAVVLKGRADPATVRRALLAFVCLLAVHYSLFLGLPVSALALRVAEPGAGGLGRLVAYQYFLATPWNAFPSLHVSACWYFYRLLSLFFRRLGLVYLVWFAGMLWGTLAIKIHFVLDGLAGLLLGEAAFRWFQHLMARQRLEGRWPSSRRMAAFYLAGIAVVFGGLAALIGAVGYTGPLYIITLR